MKIIKSLILFFALTLVSLGLSHAQTADEKQVMKQIEEFMKHRDEILKSFFDDDIHQDLESKMQKMLQDFGGGWANFNDDGTWQSTQTHKVIRIKVKQIKDKPLDIKIEKGMIHIKGETLLTFGDSKQVAKFERSYSIPNDVDQTSPEFENSEDEIIIKFKLLKKDDRLPIGPSAKELSL